MPAGATRLRPAQDLFVITPLNMTEWRGVFLLSFPVLLIDEALKWCVPTTLAPRSPAERILRITATMVSPARQIKYGKQD
jgi:hypothetical protein